MLARSGTEALGKKERHAFIEELVQAGSSIADEHARSALRRMLFYWAADATTRGELSKAKAPPSLADFAEQAAVPTVPPTETGAGEPAASARPADVISGDEVAARDEPAGESDAPAGHPAALPGPSTAEAAARPAGQGGRPASSLTEVLSNIVGETLAKTVASGQVLTAGLDKLRQATRAPHPPAETQTAAPPLETVALSDVEAVTRARAILRLAAYSRQWRRAKPDEQKDFLLHGSALAEASLYVNDDDDIRAHVAASEAARDEASDRILRTQRRWIIGLSVAFAVAVLMAAILAYQARLLNEAHKAQASLLAKYVEADRARDEASRQAAAANERLRVPDQAQGFEQRKADATPQPDSNEIASNSAQRAVAGPTMVPASAGAPQSCTGFLWFGSAGESRLDDKRDPAGLRGGEQVTINMANDLRLRAEPPSQPYVMAPQLGLVPAGSSVRVAGPPLSYMRPSGAQIWARVQVPRQFCTTVFVQYTGNAAELPSIKSQLQGIGVQVPAAEKLDTAKGKAEVRYYWPEDAAISRQVAEALARFTPNGKPLQLTPLLDFPERAKPKATNIEVWIELD